MGRRHRNIRKSGYQSRDSVATDALACVFCGTKDAFQVSDAKKDPIRSLRYRSRALTICASAWRPVKSHVGMKYWGGRGNWTYLAEVRGLDGL